MNYKVGDVLYLVPPSWPRNQVLVQIIEIRDPRFCTVIIRSNKPPDFLKNGDHRVVDTRDLRLLIKCPEYLK